MTKVIVLDGSTLEGGGQLVRVALALSAICSIPISIYNIRANRASNSSRHGRPLSSSRGRQHGRKRHTSDKGAKDAASSKVEGGLKESHLAALEYLALQCNAETVGAEIGSREVEFLPGFDKKKVPIARTSLVNLEANSITLTRPGSVWLVFQAILPYLTYHTQEQSLIGSDEGNMTELTLYGGTNVSNSMSSEYVEQVFLPYTRRIGLPRIEVEVVKRGWAGNASEVGEVKVCVQRFSEDQPVLPAFALENRGRVEKIAVNVIAEPANLRVSIINRLIEKLGGDFPLTNTEIILNEPSGDPRRMYILLVCHTSNGCRLGYDYLGTGRTPKNKAEETKIIDVACLTVVQGLRKEIDRGGCLDEFMADQMVIFQALAQGSSIIDLGTREPVIGRSEVGVKAAMPSQVVEESNEDDEIEVVDDQLNDNSGSMHTRTVRWVCNTLLKKKHIRFDEGGVCSGVGWSAAEVTKRS